MRLDLRTKFQLATKLQSVAVNENGKLTYARGWNDAKLAREFNISRVQVRAVRLAFLPEMEVARGPTPRRASLARELAEARAQIQDLSGRVSQIENLLTQPRRVA
jgi:hypothetical protein